MATHRSRRLRKKLHLDEFQELGFSVAWRFADGTTEQQIDKTVDDFINEVIAPNGLAYDGDSAVIDYLGLAQVEAHGREQVLTTTLSASALAAHRERFPAMLDADAFELRP